MLLFINNYERNLDLEFIKHKMLTIHKYDHFHFSYLPMILFENKRI